MRSLKIAFMTLVDLENYLQIVVSDLHVFNEHILTTVGEYALLSLV